MLPTLMAVVRIKLEEFLHLHGLAASRVVAETSPALSRSTVYRLLRKGDELARIDFPTLAALLVALRKLTGEDVLFNDLFEFDPDGTAPG